MNKTLIATAVSAALLAPVAAQADVTVYGRIHQGISITDTDGAETNTDFVSIGSRFGIKASSDLGNGLSAHARYEFATRTDEASSNPIGGLRLAYVGVSGGFGSLDFGQQWGAFYNTAGVHFDPTFSVGGSTYYDVGGPLRTGNTVKYSNDFGPVHLEVDKLIGDDGDEEDENDGYAIGVSVAAHENITFAAAIDDEDDTSGTAVAVRVSSGNFGGSLGWYGVDPEGEGDGASTVQLWLNGNFGNTSVWFGVGDADRGYSDDMAGNNPSDVTLAVYHNMGGGFKLLYEGISRDNDGALDDDDEVIGDSTTHLFGVRLDF